MNQPKFCAKCGAKLNENEKFCGKCGAPAQEAQPAAAPVQDAQPQAVPADAQVQTGIGAAGSALKDKKGLILIAACALIVIIVAIVIIMNLTKYQKIDAKDLFRIEFTGVNGNGKCTAVLNCPPSEDDFDALYDELIGEDAEEIEYSDYFSEDKKTLLKAYTKAKDKSEAEDMRDVLLKKNKKTGEYEITLDLSDDEGLSNGDKITCTVEYDEEDLKEENIKLTNTEFEVEVKGLKEAEQLDMFDGFELKFSGVDGHGEYSYAYKSEKYPFVSYSGQTSNYELSNGDKVSMSAYIDVSLVTDLDYIDPKEPDSGRYFTYEDKAYMVDDISAEKEFVVEGLSEPTAIDVFEGIKLQTNGAFPYLYLDGVDYEGCPEVVKSYVSFSLMDVEYDQKFTVGDSVKVRAYVSPYMENEGYKSADTPDEDGYVYKTITIEDEGYPHYFTSTTSYDSFVKLDPLFDQELKYFKEDYIGYSYCAGVSLKDDIKSFENVSEAATYISVVRGFDQGKLEKYDNKLYVYKIYKVTVKLEDKSTQTFFLSFRTDNPYIDAEGNAVYGDYVTTSCREKLNDLIKDVVKNGSVSAYEIKPGKTEDESSKADDSSSKAEDESSKADDSSSKAEDDSSELVP